MDIPKKDIDTQFSIIPQNDGSYLVEYEATYSHPSEVTDFFSDLMTLNNIQLESCNNWIKGTAVAKSMLDLEILALGLYQEPLVMYLPDEVQGTLDRIRVIEG